MRTSYCILLALLILPNLDTAPAAERFPFVIPGDDASPSITNLAHLSHVPAGGFGFVRIVDGHFATDAGRLKVWGVNVCFGANFPDPTDATKVAAHLAKLGVNGVRMHHHDTAASPRGVWGPIVNGRRTLDPQRIDRQDYFLDQLHRHGIYANLNLHVGRTFTEEEGFSTKDLPYSVRYSKYLLYFEPRMRELCKQFCREYLAHYNPYRKLKRCDDPGIAMLEITNENSFSKFGSTIAAGLPEPYRGEFQDQWNRWLADRYQNTADLKKAWSGRNEPLGKTLVKAAGWKQSLDGWRLRQSDKHPVRPLFNQPGPKAGVTALKLDVNRRAPGVSLHELQYPKLTVKPNQVYTLSFWVRADTERTLYVDVSNQGPPDWNSVGFQEQLTLKPHWQRIQRVFRSREQVADLARVCFKFGGSDVDICLADVSLRQGGEWIVLPENQSLEARNVDIPVTGWSEVALDDVRQFMVDTEKDFIRDIVSYLKQDLGVRVPITASQITYHGAEIVAETCDYTDIHAYWQHPRFPGRPWDPADWTIANTPMEASPGTDALLTRTPWRLFGRPFTISEWNIPDPHDYAASVVPFAAMVAALQDWDGVFFFQYHSSEYDWYTDKVQRYFSFNGQPAKLALLTACANLYRRGDLPPLSQKAGGTIDQLQPATLALSHRIGIDLRAAEPSQMVGPVGHRLASPDESAVWDASKGDRAFVSVNTPATRAAWGLIGGRSFDLGGVRFRVGNVDRNYAAVVFTSMDGKPLESSERILLTAVGSAANQDMTWNDQRRSVGRQWGRGPTHVNGVPIDVQLPSGRWRVRALSGQGRPHGEVFVNRAGHSRRFSVGPEHQTLWYVIEAR